MFTLVIDGQPRGPYTRAECRAEVEALGVERWHWEMRPDGSLHAVADDDGRTLAEVVPA